MNADFRFNQCRSIEEAEAALQLIIPIGTSCEDVYSLFKHAGAQVSVERFGLFATYSQGARRPGLLGLADVTTDWNCSCGFDEDDRLTGLAVNKGHTGL